MSEIKFLKGEYFTFKNREEMRLKIGRHHIKRIVPPAGPDYAFDIEVWAHTLDISVSPTGRSVSIWLDGEKLKIGDPR